MFAFCIIYLGVIMRSFRTQFLLSLKLKKEIRSHISFIRELNNRVSSFIENKTLLCEDHVLCLLYLIYTNPSLWKMNLNKRKFPPTESIYYIFFGWILMRSLFKTHTLSPSPPLSWEINKIIWNDKNSWMTPQKIYNNNELN